MDQVFTTEIFINDESRPSELVGHADPLLSIVKDEQFGPALPIMKLHTEDEAVRLTNDNAFGLCRTAFHLGARRVPNLRTQND
jgi:acyl-CoA reductase-like NAD-dependent aldehyde dehydrogenase